MNPLNENEIAQKLINGELSGIVTNGDFFYLPMRLTGTGLAERVDSDGKARHLDRKMELFTTDDLMAQYANIPVVLGHPKNEDGEYVRVGFEAGIIVGNTIASYVKEDEKEIWVIARIHNKEVIDAIGENDLSTSPHFISTEKEQDGSEIYLEIPKGINSLAIVSSGFWDKKSDIPPIDKSEFNLLDKEAIMQEEKTDGVLETEASGSENKVDTEQKQDENKADESLEEKVADLEENEAKEAKSFEKLAEDHKELDKGDSMDNEVKKDLVAQEAVEKMDESKEAKEEKVEEVTEDKMDSDLIEGEEFTPEDGEREKLIEVISDIVDSADAQIGVKRVFFGTQRLKPSALIKRFASANKNFVSSKYAGMVDKVDASTLEIGKDILQDIKANIQKKNAELFKEADQKEASVITHRNGTRSFKI